MAFGWIVAYEPVTTMNLDVFVENEVQRFASRDLGDRCLDGEFFDRGQRGNSLRRIVGRAFDPLIDESSNTIEQAFERIRAHDHLADLVPDRSEVGDWLTELTACGCIPDGFADRTLRPAAAGGAQLEPAEVQDIEGNLVSLTDLAEHIVRRDPDVLKDDGRRRRSVEAHLVLFLAAREPSECTFDNERCEVLPVDLGK